MAHAGKESWVYRNRGGDARTENRGQRWSVFGGERGVAESAALRSARARGSAVRANDGVFAFFHLLSELPRLAAGESVLRGVAIATFRSECDRSSDVFRSRAAPRAGFDGRVLDSGKTRGARRSHGGAEVRVNADAMAGRAVRLSDAPEDTRRNNRCDFDARARDRSKHGVVQHDQRGAVELASVQQPERLVTLAARDSGTRNPINVSYGLVQDWKERSKSFECIAMYRDWQPTLTGQGKPEVLRAVRASYDFFRTLGVRPALGRDFRKEEDRPDRKNAVLLSYGLWRERFAGQAGILGSNIQLNEASYEIIGVLPRDFEARLFYYSAEPPQIWGVLGYDASQPF